MRNVRRTLVLGTLPAIIGCGASAPFHPTSPADAAAGSPLGPSYILVPLPNDDETLLGRVLLDVPEKGRSLDEVSRPNPCADKLTPKKDGPLASTFEDAQELAAGGKARAALGAFGFEGDAQTATHFYYKLEVSKRVAQTDTTDYVACCKEKGSCGYGFVSALVYGDGQYSTATENSAEGSVSIPIAGGAGGFVKAKILHRRNVHGYVAAVITVTDGAASKSISVLGDPAAAGIPLTEQSLPEQVKARFEAQRIQVVKVEHPKYRGVEFAYALKDGSGEITEAEFVDRYAALTGMHDLDGAAASSIGVPFLVGGIAALVVGCSIGAVGAANIKKDGGGTTSDAHLAMFVGGISVGAIGGITGITLGAVFLSQAAERHRITKFDADLYVAKYNRALLRKTIQDTRERMQQLSGSAVPFRFTVTPIVSPTFSGVVGTF